MVSAHNVTTKLDFVKPLQYITEGDSVATPSLYGVTPSSSTFVLVGNNTEINPQLNIDHVDVVGLGSADILDAVLTGKAYAFSIRYNPIDLALWEYLWNDASGTSSSDESLSFTYSYKLDGTEFFRHIRGARPTSGTLSVSRGLWEADLTFIAKDITVPSTTDGNGGTPVYSSSETSSAAISHQDGGGSPFEWNSVNYGERRFSISVARSVSIMDVNGELDIVYSKLNDRRVTWSADVFVGTASQETTLETDFEAKTKRAMTYKFTSAPGVTLTTANNVLTSFSEVPAAGNTDALIASIAGRCESVTNL